MVDTTRFEPGYQIRNKVAIYGGGHVSVGAEVWALWMQFRSLYPKSDTWLVFDNTLSYAYYRSGVLVKREAAHCTGLPALPIKP